MNLTIPCEFDAHSGTFLLQLGTVRGVLALGSVRIAIPESGVEIGLPFQVTGFGLVQFIEELDHLDASHDGMARLYSPPLHHTIHGLWIIRRPRWYDASEGQRIRMDLCGSLIVGESGEPAHDFGKGRISYDYADMSMRYTFQGLRIEPNDLPRIRAEIRRFVDERQPDIAAPPAGPG
jgi:hypothetical protein